MLLGAVASTGESSPPIRFVGGYRLTAEDYVDKLRSTLIPWMLKVARKHRATFVSTFGTRKCGLLIAPISTSWTIPFGIKFRGSLLEASFQCRDPHRQRDEGLEELRPDLRRLRSEAPEGHRRKGIRVRIVFDLFSKFRHSGCRAMSDKSKYTI